MPAQVYNIHVRLPHGCYNSKSNGSFEGPQLHPLLRVHPYNNCEVGLAMNISRPVQNKNSMQTEVSLGFHFDSINSSPVGSDVTKFVQARGATGIISIE